MNRRRSEDRAGLYFTVIVHFAVVCLLLVLHISTFSRAENSFVLDFTRQEAEEAREKEEQQAREQEAFDEEIAARISRMLAEAGAQAPRNIAVDRSSLKDDRGTDADKLYEDAARLAKDLKDGLETKDDGFTVPVADQHKQTQRKDKAKEYSGPSIVSYNLDGRKASRLPVPAYRCMGAGTVTVIITVNPQGRVTDAKVLESVSTDDRCLRDYAIRAARLSLFSSSPTAPPRQNGDIVYAFIAQ